MNQVDFTSLSSEELCQRLRSQGKKVLMKVADIIEEEELDGEDLVDITYEELCQLLPTLGMRKKLEAFMADMGFRTKVRAKVPKIHGQEENGPRKRRKLENGVEKNSNGEEERRVFPHQVQTTAAFEIISDTDDDDKDAPSGFLVTNGKTIEQVASEDSEEEGEASFEIVSDSDDDGEDIPVTSPAPSKKRASLRAMHQLKLPKGKFIPKEEDMKNLAAKINVEVQLVRRVVWAAEKMRRSVFLRNLPRSRSPKEIEILKKQLSQHVRATVKVLSSQLEFEVKVFMPMGLLVVAKEKGSLVNWVVRALNRYNVDPGKKNKKIFAQKASSPLLSSEKERELFTKLRPILNQLYPALSTNVPSKKEKKPSASAISRKASPKKKTAVQLKKAATAKLTAKTKKPSTGTLKGCPGNHVLKQFTGKSCIYGCNLCRKRFHVVYGCRVCNWDVCIICRKTSTSGSTPSTPRGVKGKATSKEDLCKGEHQLIKRSGRFNLCSVCSKKIHAVFRCKTCELDICVSCLKKSNKKPVEVCRRFARSGRCPHGAACKYRHVTSPRSRNDTKKWKRRRRNRHADKAKKSSVVRKATKKNTTLNSMFVRTTRRNRRRKRGRKSNHTK